MWDAKAAVQHLKARTASRGHRRSGTIMTHFLSRAGTAAMCATVALLTPLGMASAHAAPLGRPAPGAEQQGDTAQATARDFYVWYVGLMAQDKEPGDDPAHYARFVSKRLRAAIARKMNSADGMDVDYFIKAQDYLDGWVGHVTATPATPRGGGARALVTLGGGSRPWRLAVSLVREDQRWKISDVTRG